jgi:hypothetical protein
MKRTRKELKAEIRDLRERVDGLTAEIRNKPPVAILDSATTDAVEAYICNVYVECPDIDGIKGLRSMALQVTGPFSREWGHVQRVYVVAIPAT